MSSVHSGLSPSQLAANQGRIDDVSASVNKQIKELEVSKIVIVLYLISLFVRINWLLVTICFNYSKKKQIKSEKKLMS